MPQKIDDFGFGKKYNQKAQKFIKDNGHYNVKRLGGKFYIKDFYSYLINVSGSRFFAFFICSFLSINAIFGMVYRMLGNDALKGIENFSWENDYIHGFFFSVQTFTTVGYGAVAPHSIAANWIASLNAFVGISWAALMAGLLFGRFSKPTPRIAFSQKVLLDEKENQKNLQIRLVNERVNVMMDMEASIIFSYLKTQQRAERTYHRLDLEIDKILFFPLNWTIVHEINTKSPLYGKSSEELEQLGAELLVLVKGFDNTFHQTVYAMHSYLYQDFQWQAKFKPMFNSGEDGSILLFLEYLNQIIPDEGIQ